MYVALLGELVRVDDDGLVDSRYDAAHDNEHDDPDGDGERPPLAPPPDVPHQQGGEQRAMAIVT